MKLFLNEQIERLFSFYISILNLVHISLFKIIFIIQ